jgi:hypothetical protein
MVSTFTQQGKPACAMGKGAADGGFFVGESLIF